MDKKLWRDLIILVGVLAVIYSQRPTGPRDPITDFRGFI